jgi:hypothetical protein
MDVHNLLVQDVYRGREPLFSTKDEEFLEHVREGTVPHSFRCLISYLAS